MRTFPELLLNFTVLLLQMHMMGILFMRLFRPTESLLHLLLSGETGPVVSEGPVDSRAAVLRFLKAFLAPTIAAILALVLPTPNDFLDQPFLFGGWLLVSLTALSFYLAYTRRAHPLLEGLPTAVLFLTITSACDTAVHYILTTPALRGPFDPRVLGIDFVNGTILPAAFSASFFEQAANLFLVGIVITLLAFPPFVIFYPKKLRLTVASTFLVYALVLLAPTVLYTRLLVQITPHRSYAPFELFLLLGPILVGLLFFFRNARVLRGVEQQRRAYLDKDAELAVQRFYNQQVQPIVENLRRQRHGHENSLAVLAGLARARDLDGIEAFLTRSTEDPVHLAPIDESALHRVRSAALLGLLSAKTAEARSRDIRFEFSALTEVTDLPVPVFTLCEILGILLDNALEAAESATCPFVRFEILPQETSLVFRISNTFATAPDLDRLGDKGYTTKSDGHGLGLHIVRARLRRLPGVQLNAALETPWFSQELLVPDAVPQSTENGGGI